ncbi:MAG: tRNA epoxyqueuosine(34) reductase QueG [Acidobacteria bacterium]|nr:tRNA epoxyqueuosine(34) reductase QueG [Acidobacteriota bacterium]
MSLSHAFGLTARIRAEARALGFFRAGIARAGETPRGRHLREWLGRGFHGDMRYLERRQGERLDPRLVLPGARSVIVAAMECPAPPLPERAPLRGRMARYAPGDDYHTVVGDRIARLLDFIQKEVPSARGKGYVDAGPVMEKAWGAQSGLGWIGKHSLLVTRERGSWCNLGVLLVDLELEADPPAEDGCGDCARCIGACPTGAIVAPRVLDARRCISYLTIELRGSIPRALRPLLGGRVFGCDACQEVCPWSFSAGRAAGPEEDEGFDLPALAALTAEGFAVRFGSSPVRRIGRDRLVRNAVVALGNSGDPGAVVPLGDSLRDRSALVRAHAAWALGRLPCAAARRLLETARDREKDPEVLGEIGAALAGRE